MTDYSLSKLSDAEHALYKEVISRISEEELGKVMDNYSNLHLQYLELYDNSSDSEVKLEALKRLIFLNWYSLVEPGYLTGVGTLDLATVSQSYSRLNDLMMKNGLDKEFKWMLSAYACWGDLLIKFIDPELHSLIDFLANVDTTVLHSPQLQLAKGAMDDRG